MTHFYFVRHCETELNTQPHIVGGRSNHTPPTAKGRTQARLFGHYLRHENIVPDIVVSSGAVRTRTTAQLALETAGIECPIETDERLLEVSQGIFEGQSRRQVYTADNILHYRIEAMDGKFPGGESILDAQIRKRNFVSETHTAHRDKLILVFGHGLAIRALVGHALDLSKTAIFALTTDNLSLTHLEAQDHGLIVHSVGKNVIDA